MERNFAVKSTSFALYKALKEEAEARGWKWCLPFGAFKEEKMKHCDCFYFTTGAFNPGGYNGNQFCFSNTVGEVTTYDINKDWGTIMSELEYAGCSVPKITTVTLSEIAKWKGVNKNDIAIQFT